MNEIGITNTEISAAFKIEKKYEENPALALIDMKEFVIGHMRDFQIRFYKQNEKENEDIKQRLFDIEKKLDNHNVKIESILDETQTYKNKIEKINELVLFSKKTSDQIMSIDIKLGGLQKDFSNACYKYDKIYLDNLNVPGTIGDYCKYKNMREYIETSITQVQNLLSYKEKNSAEFKVYKEKFENLITGLSSQLESVERGMKNFTTKLLQDTEVNFKREYENIGVKIGDMRMENNKYAYQLQKNANELTAEKEKILTIKNEVNKQLDDALARCREMNKSTVDNFETIKGEYQNIKSKFVELSEFIKDVRFRKNLGVEVSKQDIKKLTNKITAEKPKMNIFVENSNIKNNLFTEKDGLMNINAEEISNKINNNIIYNLDNYKEEEFEENNSDDYNVESYVKEYIKGKSSNVKQVNNNISLKQLNSNSKKSDSNKKSNSKKNKLSKEDGYRNTRDNIDCDTSNRNIIKINNENNIENLQGAYLEEIQINNKQTIKEDLENSKNIQKMESLKNKELVNHENSNIKIEGTFKIENKTEKIKRSESSHILEREENKAIDNVIKNLDIDLEENNVLQENYSSDSKLSPDNKELNINKFNQNTSTANPNLITKNLNKIEFGKSKSKSKSDNKLRDEIKTSPIKNILGSAKESTSNNNAKQTTNNSSNNLNNNSNKNLNNINKNNTKKVKEKFSIEVNNNDNKKQSNGNNNSSWSLEKIEEEEKSKKTYLNTEVNTLNSNNTNSNSNFHSVKNNNSNMTNKEFASILSEFNEKFFLFKKEFFKRISDTEQKINQMEYFSKKKFEELAGQIKNYLPINFNPYMKDFKDKISENANSNTKINQLNVENLIINENLGGQNFSLKVIDTSNFKLPQNLNPVKKNLKNIVLNKTNNNFLYLNNNTNTNFNLKTARNASASNTRPILKETSKNFPNLNTSNLQPAIHQINNMDLKIDESDFARDYSFIENVTKITRSKDKIPNFNSNNNNLLYNNPKIDTSDVPKNHFLSLNSVLTNKPKNKAKE